MNRTKNAAVVPQMNAKPYQVSLPSHTAQKQPGEAVLVGDGRYGGERCAK